MSGEWPSPRGLALGARNKAEWDQPAVRRQGLRDLYRLHRYGVSFRAPRALPLAVDFDRSLPALEALRWFVAHPWSTALLVMCGERIVFEHYAADFAPGQLHSLQSITKTSVHLLAGRLIERGLLDPTRQVCEYLPGIGSGYAAAPVQDLLDMAVDNDYTEDYGDPGATVGLLEDAHGWRVLPGYSHINLREFLATVTASTPTAGPRRLYYKTANTDVVAWICESLSRQELRSYYLELVEAAGTEDIVHLSTDRVGTPFAGGGLHMSLRDLGRYGLLLARGGSGLGGLRVGSTSFRDATRAQCVAGTPSLLGSGHYRNFTETEGTWLGHNGYGGQWLMAYPESEIVIACLSGLADAGGHDWSYLARLAAMGEQIAGELTGGAHARRSKAIP